MDDEIKQHVEDYLSADVSIKTDGLITAIEKIIDGSKDVCEFTKDLDLENAPEFADYVLIKSILNVAMMIACNAQLLGAFHDVITTSDNKIRNMKIALFNYVLKRENKGRLEFTMPDGDMLIWVQKPDETEAKPEPNENAA